MTRLTAITTNTETGWFLDLNDEVVYRIGLFTRERLTTWMVVCSKISGIISFVRFAYEQCVREQVLIQ